MAALWATDLGSRGIRSMDVERQFDYKPGVARRSCSVR